MPHALRKSVLELHKATAPHRLLKEMMLNMQTCRQEYVRKLKPQLRLARLKTARHPLALRVLHRTLQDKLREQSAHPVAQPLQDNRKEGQARRVRKADRQHLPRKEETPPCATTRTDVLRKIFPMTREGQ